MGVGGPEEGQVATWQILPPLPQDTPAVGQVESPKMLVVAQISASEGLVFLQSYLVTGANVDKGVGSFVGVLVGSEVGSAVGFGVGTAVGSGVGEMVVVGGETEEGVLVGSGEGAFVG